MAYITSIERHGIQKGRIEANRNTVFRVLRAKFGEIPSDFLERVASIEDASILEELVVKAAMAGSLAEVRQSFPS